MYMLAIKFRIYELFLLFQIMDVGELLNFKPAVAPKRPAASVEEADAGFEEEFDDDPNESYEKRAAKRRRLRKAAQEKVEEQRLAMLEAEAAAAAAANSQDRRPKDDILAKLEQEDEDVGGDDIDETKLKRMILNFEKRIAKNQELRIKFPDDPPKFMSSEMELHDAIQEMRVVATAPDLYPVMVDMVSE
jgi:beta-catenin-like protein 1